MNKNLSKLSLVFFGFVAGVAFLISCGGGSSNGVSLPINDADATVPQIADQMFCIANSNDSDIVNDIGTVPIICMKQSTKVKETYDNLSGPYSEGWILINQANYGTNGTVSFLFYK